MDRQDLLGGGGKFGSSTDELLKKIQRSIIDAVYHSRHSEVREIRKWHRHYSPKAKARKKARRRMVSSSRGQNR